MKTLVLFIIGFIYSTLLFGQVSTIAIGETVDLSKYSLVTANDKKIASDKVIILDFWATWCAPCIASFPHLEALQNKYKDKAQVVAISDESKEKVEKFLTKRKYSLSFFVDNNASIFKLFDIGARPMTALLSEKGKLLWVGHSENVDKAVQLYLKEKPLETATVINEMNRKYYRNKIQEADTVKPVFTYQIAMSKESESYFAKMQKGVYVDSAIDIKYTAVPVSEILQDLLSVPDMQLENRRADLDTTLVSLVAKSKASSITYRNTSKRIIADLEGIFQFKIKNEVRSVPSYHLKVIDANKLEKFRESIDGGGMVQAEGNKILMTRLTLEQAAGYFQKKLNLFIDFAGQEHSKYNITLDKFVAIEDLNKQLFEKYGLSLTAGTSSLEFVEVR